MAVINVSRGESLKNHEQYGEIIARMGEGEQRMYAHAPSFIYNVLLVMGASIM